MYCKYINTETIPGGLVKTNNKINKIFIYFKLFKERFNINSKQN